MNNKRNYYNQYRKKNCSYRKIMEAPNKWFEKHMVRTNDRALRQIRICHLILGGYEKPIWSTKTGILIGQKRYE
jgi:hypothetical protein